MTTESQQVVAQILKYLTEQLWSGVAISIISKKLALTAAKLESFQFISSYIQNATQNKQAQSSFMCQKDPMSIPTDNLNVGDLPKQQNKDKKLRKVSLSESINQTRSRKFTMQSSCSKKSPDKQKIIAQQKPDGGLITLPEQDDPHYIEDPEEEKSRTYKFKTQKQSKDMKKLMEERLKQRSENSVKNKKMIKQLKKYTYDYDGKFFGIGVHDAGHQKMLRLEKQNGSQQLVSKQLRNPEQKQIINEKIKQRQTRSGKSFLQDDKNQPKFDQNRPQSLIDLFEQETKLSQGIRLIGQKGNQKIIKQKPRRKLSGLKQYRRSEYEGIIKDKKFKDFKKLSFNVSSPSIVNKIIPNVDEQKQTFFNQNNDNNSHSEMVINLNKNEQLNNTILPPIKSSYIKKANKFGLNKLYGGYSQSSRSILNQSSFTSKKSQKSQIKIDHEELYTQIISNPYHMK